MFLNTFRLLLHKVHIFIGGLCHHLTRTCGMEELLQAWGWFLAMPSLLFLWRTASSPELFLFSSYLLKWHFFLAIFLKSVAFFFVVVVLFLLFQRIHRISLPFSLSCCSLLLAVESRQVFSFSPHSKNFLGRSWLMYGKHLDIEYQG